MESDPFLQNLESSELQIAKEVFTKWLPFLTKDSCKGCEAALLDRVQSLNTVNERNPGDAEEEEADCGVKESDSGCVEEVSDVAGGFDGYFRASHEGWEHIKATGWDSDPEPGTPSARMSWADMVQQEQLEDEKLQVAKKFFLENEMEGGNEDARLKKNELSREQMERAGFAGVAKKNDFVFLQRIEGRIVNILDGLELHTGVFSAVEQQETVDLVYELQEKGRNNELGEHAYSEECIPRKDMRGKGHTTIQFGCCYNSMEHNRSPRGIVHGALADPMPSVFKVMIKRLIDSHVIPASCEPDCCRVNIFEIGDFLPPDISCHGFVRPFCTVSLLNECSINFGSNLIEEDAGKFIESTAITLPVGSVLVLDGKGADVAQHCVPTSPSKRITVTFWKMEKNILLQRLEPDLQNIRSVESDRKTNEMRSSAEIRAIGAARKFSGRSNRARGWKDSIKARGSVFERLTPGKKSSHPSADANSTTNHSSIDSTRDSGAAFPDEADGLQGRYQHGWKNNNGGDINRNMVSSERSASWKNDEGASWKNDDSVHFNHDRDSIERSASGKEDDGHFNRDGVSSQRSSSWKNNRSVSWKGDHGERFANRRNYRSANRKDDVDGVHFNGDVVSSERSAGWRNDRSASWKDDDVGCGHVSGERSASSKNDNGGGHFNRDWVSIKRSEGWKDDENGGYFNRDAVSSERSASWKNDRNTSSKDDDGGHFKNDKISWKDDDDGATFNHNGVSSEGSARRKNNRSLSGNNDDYDDDDDGHFNCNKVYSGRSVRMDQKRIIITRNLNGEDDSFTGMSKSAHSPFRISTSKTNHRRVRVVQ